VTALPTKPLPTASIDIAGVNVAYRSLSRSEALRMQTFKGREDEAEIFLLVCGTGCTEEEAQAFRDSNDTETAGLLIDAIIVISGLTKSITADGKGPDGRRLPDPKPSGSAT
jgi:hypothetical protein